MVRKIDSIGRIVLPLAMRRALGLETGSALHIECRDGCIILHPAAAPAEK